MIYQEIAARVTLSADVTGTLIDLPASIDDGQIIELVLVGGYNADLEFAKAQSNTPKLPVWDDTGVTPKANTTIWIGPRREAPLYAFAAAPTAISVIALLVREG